MKYTNFFLFDPANDRKHKYFKKSTELIPGRIPFATLLLVEYYINKNQTAISWKKDKSLKVVNWEKQEGSKKIKVTSKPFNYRVILEHIKNTKGFSPRAFDLPDSNEPFLDIPTTFAVGSHHITNNNEIQSHFQPHITDDFLGESFPIRPTLCREGFMIGSFLEDYLRRIIDERNKLIHDSNNVFSFEWFFRFKDLIGNAFSSLEVALHLIYNKAKYDPKKWWTFDQELLGPKEGVRFSAKLEWVRKISGKAFDIEPYMKSLQWLRELRNHLNHFDPPSFCLTLEECAEILNAVIDIGMIHITMRKSLGIRPSTALINLILQPQVHFIPEENCSRRIPPNKLKEGYNSCRWPNPTSLRGKLQ